MSPFKPPQSWSDPFTHWIQIISHPYYRALAEVQHNLHYGVNDFFKASGLKVLDLPVTTGSISSPMGLGSDSKPVLIEVFGCHTYLSDSMQFLLELGCRIFKSGTAYKMVSFRGEETDASHLAQFHHAECEIPGNLEDVIKLGGDFIDFLAGHLLNYCPDAIKSLAGSCEHLEELLKQNGSFPQIPLDDAVRELKGMGDIYTIKHHMGFELPNRLGEAKINESYGHGLAVWITHFPHLAVPFYQAFDTSNLTIALNADLVLGNCETIGAGQRHAIANDVRRALQLHYVDEKPYDWYIHMRELQPMQTSGFGLGIERFLMWVLKQSDIRDCTLIYRGSDRNSVP